MHGANSYNKICDVLTEGFKYRYPHKQTIITGIVLARPYLPLAKEQVVPNLNYWFHRSDRYTDFFCGGYIDGEEKGIKDIKKVGEVNEKTWYFSDSIYVSFENEIQSMSSWIPGGGTDLILTNARFDKQKQEANLDLTTALAIDLEVAKNDNTFLDVPHLFQDIFEFAKKINESTSFNPVDDLSNALGFKLARTGLKEVLLAWLPEAIRKPIRGAFHAAVIDISKKK